MTNYTFSVVATNSIGSGEAGVLMITTPGKIGDPYIVRTYICTYVHTYTKYVYAFVLGYSYYTYVRNYLTSCVYTTQY